MRTITLTEIELDELLQAIEERVTKAIDAKLSQQQQETLLTVTDTCKLLQVSKPTLSAWTKEGKIKQHRIGSRVRYKHAEIMQSMASLKKYKQDS